MNKINLPIAKSTSIKSLNIGSVQLDVNVEEKSEDKPQERSPEKSLEVLEKAVKEKVFVDDLKEDKNSEDEQ